VFGNIAEYNSKYYIKNERIYIKALNQQMIDGDKTFCESWIISMKNILDMACQVQGKVRGEIGVLLEVIN